MHQGFGGKMSVLKSVFYNNSAGSNNEKDGEVALSHISWITCLWFCFDAVGDDSSDELSTRPLKWLDRGLSTHMTTIRWGGGGANKTQFVVEVPSCLSVLGSAISGQGIVLQVQVCFYVDRVL